VTAAAGPGLGNSAQLVKACQEGQFGPCCQGRPARQSVAWRQEHLPANQAQGSPDVSQVPRQLSDDHPGPSRRGPGARRRGHRDRRPRPAAAHPRQEPAFAAHLRPVHPFPAHLRPGQPFPAHLRPVHPFPAIATNLLPFTGLDGSWLLADAVGVPDLSRRARGAVSRLVTAVVSRQPRTSADNALAVYAALNGLVAAALLLTAGFFWYQLFGGLVGTLASRGPAGLAALAVAAVVLGRPAVVAVAAQLPAATAGARGLYDAIAFRLQWRWRIPAAEQLTFAHPELGRLTSAQLGILAGQLSRTRHRGQLPAGLAGGYGIVRAGTATAAYVTGQALTLTRGATWGPRHQLFRAARRATLVHVDAASVRQLLSEAEPDTATP
jgi:hypothetical protein